MGTAVPGLGKWLSGDFQHPLPSSGPWFSALGGHSGLPSGPPDILWAWPSCPEPTPATNRSCQEPFSLETGRAVAVQRGGQPASSETVIQGATKAPPGAALSPKVRTQQDAITQVLWLTRQESPRRRGHPPWHPKLRGWERDPVQDVLPVSPGTRGSGAVGP